VTAERRPFTTAIHRGRRARRLLQDRLPSASATAPLLVTLTRTRRDRLRLGLRRRHRRRVRLHDEPVTVVPVGTGDVQVSLSWSTLADVDLHVVDPSNERSTGRKRESVSGARSTSTPTRRGQRRPAQREHHVARHGAPSGTYRVLVDLWSSCTATRNAVHGHGQRPRHEPQTFSGTLTWPAIDGGPGAGMRSRRSQRGGRAQPRGHRLVGTFDVEPAP